MARRKHDPSLPDINAHGPEQLVDTFRTVYWDDGMKLWVFEHISYTKTLRFGNKVSWHIGWTETKEEAEAGAVDGTHPGIYGLTDPYRLCTIRSGVTIGPDGTEYEGIPKGSRPWTFTTSVSPHSFEKMRDDLRQRWIKDGKQVQL